ncbi:MAG: 2-hydroxyacid dehydrogenase [Pseudobdellovibrionaceae bacterium]
MKIAFFDTHSYDREAFEACSLASQHQLTFFHEKLNGNTSGLAKGTEAVCCFVNDRLDRKTLTDLKAQGVKLVLLRCAGFNQVDLVAASELALPVARVPEYSPHAVAEHAVALLMNLNRKIHRSYNRVREGNFSIEHLVGFDVFGKTVGVLGTGRIGRVFCEILLGFGARVVAFDLKKDLELEKKGITYDSFEKVLKVSDIVSLHLPLNEKTRHLIDDRALGLCKKGVVLLNTSRGALVDTKALIKGLKSGHVGAAGLDVYEEEEFFFFNDLSDSVIQDDLLARLMTFPNVILTSHQAFLTKEALANIAWTTLNNASTFELKKPLQNEVHVESHSPRGIPEK